LTLLIKMVKFLEWGDKLKKREILSAPLLF
jgi:hypothetical protein